MTAGPHKDLWYFFFHFEMSERAPKDTILNIPVPTSSANRSSMATPTSSMGTPKAPASEASEDQVSLVPNWKALIFECLELGSKGCGTTFSV